VQALPRVEAPAWRYNGTHAIRHGNSSADAHVWHYHVAHNQGYGEINIDWRLYVREEDSLTPLRLDMWGVNWFSGGHWDHYVAEFYEFEAHPAFANGAFDVPELCDGAPLPCAPALLSAPYALFGAYVAPRTAVQLPCRRRATRVVADGSCAARRLFRCAPLCMHCAGRSDAVQCLFQALHVPSRRSTAALQAQRGRDAAHRRPPPPVIVSV
jgi:hypothetical protein